MFSIRSFARSAPRNVSRLATAIRPATRSVSLLRSFKPLTSVSRTQQYAAAFSTSSIRRSGSELQANAQGDVELAAKIANEIEMETEMKEEQDVSTTVKEYLENGPFEIIDTPGNEEVTLKRTFGTEKITITFSVADLNAIDPESDYQDRAMEDEEDVIDGKQTSENPEDPENDQEEEPSFPARLNIVIEKPGKGALAIESVVQDGMVVIDNVYHYADASLAHAKSAEKVHERQDMYVGPPFGNLDEDLQVLFERYLDERGINSVLALFVPEYIDMKEQKEYLRWLENVKGFVEA